MTSRYMESRGPFYSTSLHETDAPIDGTKRILLTIQLGSIMDYMPCSPPNGVDDDYS